MKRFKFFSKIPNDIQVLTLKYLNLSLSNILVSKTWLDFFKPQIKTEFLRLLKKEDTYKNISFDHIFAMKECYQDNENDEAEFFIALKYLEGDLLDKHKKKCFYNPVYYDRKTDEIDYLNRLIPFLAKKFGLAGIIGWQNIDFISDGCEKEALIGLPPLIALEMQLKNNFKVYMRELALINCLFESESPASFTEQRLRVRLEFNDNQLFLWFTYSNEDINYFNFMNEHNEKFRNKVVKDTNSLKISMYDFILEYENDNGFMSKVLESANSLLTHVESNGKGVYL